MRIIKKPVFIVMAAFLTMSLLFAGCSPEAGTQEILWTITVEKEGGSSVEFTNVDASGIEMVAVEAVKDID